MLGASGVGKTSLVARFVFSTFSDEYLTTAGVKIVKKSLDVKGAPCELMVWDVAGEDEFVTVQMSYLQHADGYLLVVDGTRHATLDTAMDLQAKAIAVAGNVPFLLLLNKSDLRDRWEIDSTDMRSLYDSGFHAIHTSALTGEGVEKAFATLAAEMLEKQ
jgi:hypothetical protein